MFCRWGMVMSPATLADAHFGTAHGPANMHLRDEPAREMTQIPLFDPSMPSSGLRVVEGSRPPRALALVRFPGLLSIHFFCENARKINRMMVANIFMTPNPRSGRHGAATSAGARLGSLPRSAIHSLFL